MEGGEIEEEMEEGMEGGEIDEKMEEGIEEEVDEEQEEGTEGETDEEQEERTEGETDEEGEGAEEGEKDEEQEELIEGETDEENEEGIEGEKDEEQEEGTGETDEEQEGTEGRGGVGVGAVKEEGLAQSVGARGGREGRGVAGNPPSVAGTPVEPPRRPESARATAPGRPVEPRRLAGSVRLAGSPPPLAESPKPAGSVGRAETEELVERDERFRVVRAARSAILTVLLASEELARSLGLVASEELRRVTLPSRVSSAESLLPSVMVSCWGKREISRATRNEESATKRNYEN